MQLFVLKSYHPHVFTSSQTLFFYTPEEHSSLLSQNLLQREGPQMLQVEEERIQK